jgi:small GTP-binding protein
MRFPNGLALRRQYEASSSHTSCLAWAPAGSRIASAHADGSVVIWDAEGEGCVRVAATNGGPILDLAWSPDAKLLVVSSADGSVALLGADCEAVRGIIRMGIEGHHPTVVAVSGDGDALAVGATDSITRLYSLPSLTPLAELVPSPVVNLAPGSHPAPADAVVGMQWSPPPAILGRHEPHGAVGPGETVLVVVHANGAQHDWAIQLPRIPDSVDGLVSAPFERMWYGNGTGASAMAWSPDGSAIAVANRDGGISVRGWHSRRAAAWRAHQHRVLALSFSSDGRIMASKAADGELKLWRCDTWQEVALFRASCPGDGATGLAFGPRPSALAFTGLDDRVIYLCDVDIHALCEVASGPKAARYNVGKIVVVGDSGVGKTCLAWRLLHGEFLEHASSHGQQVWEAPSLSQTLPDGTRCELALWDLAGQPDYRLVHTLFLGDVDLALVVFDAADLHEPLKGVEYWLKALFRGRTFKCPTILVAARCDRGTPAVAEQDVLAFCESRGVKGGYVVTSALTGQGMDELAARMRQHIPWIDLANDVSERWEVTQRSYAVVRETVKELKTSVTREHTVLTVRQLWELLVRRLPDPDFSYLNMQMAVSILSHQGYVTVLPAPQHEEESFQGLFRLYTGCERVVLKPVLLSNVASSLILEARRSPRGLGALPEGAVLRGEYALPELADLADADREALLDGAVALFIKRHVCFRESVGDTTLLVFPALISQKRPDSTATSAVEGPLYRVRGAVGNLYAALVARLGYTNTFRRVHQWHNQAEYEVTSGDVCGLKVVAETEGSLDIVLQYAEGVSPHARALFEALVEFFLDQRKAEVERYDPVSCLSCGYRQQRTEVVGRVAAGQARMFCSECGKAIELADPRARPRAADVSAEDLATERATVARKTTFEENLTHVKRLIERRRFTERPPTCFISYAWGRNEHGTWVERRLATDLSTSGVRVILDRWSNAVGSDVARFVSSIDGCDFVISVGTPLYREKYENKSAEYGTLVAAEVDLIHQRLTGTEARKETVLPVLLEGDRENSLPPLMRGKVYADFRDQANYFAALLDLLLSLHRVPLDDAEVMDVRSKLGRPLA